MYYTVKNRLYIAIEEILILYEVLHALLYVLQGLNLI